MTIRFRLLPAGLEEAQFKRVPEGWLFTTASPWLFARRRTYLVSDAQKPALAARVRRGRYVRLMLAIPMLLLLVATLVLVPSLPRSRSVEMWALLGGFVVLFTIVILLGDYLNIRSLLRDVPRTSQKITLAEMLRNQADAMSVKALSVFTAIFIFAAATNMLQSLASGGNVFGAIGAIIFVLLAVVFSAMLVVRLQKQAPAETGPELTIGSLAARLERMERLNHILFRSLAAVGFLAVLGPFIVLTVLQLRVMPLNVQSVGAQSFVVRNSSGDNMASLFTGRDGMPNLILYDAQHSRRINIGLTENGSPYVSLTDAQVKLRAALGLNNSQEPNLLFLDPQAKVRASIGLRGDLPSVWLADAQGRLRAQLTLDDKQEPALAFIDAQQRSRALFGLDVNSSPVLKLFGSDGTVRWDAAAGAAKDVPAPK